MINQEKRQILLCVLGMTPQIITETLYALTQGHKEHVDEIRVITMLKGCDLIKKLLLDPHEGKFFDFCRDYGIDSTSIKFDESTIAVVHTPDGVMLEDIRSLKEDRYAATQISEIVRELTQNPNTSIHASAAGGRKTMALHLLTAMQQYGRPQDKLWHVLVSKELQTHPDFFYIPLVPREFQTPYGRYISTETAQINLVDIPFLRTTQSEENRQEKKIADYKLSSDHLLSYEQITRSIEFSPEHYQAGLSILNYFGTLIRHRYPDIPVTVCIEQEGLAVRLIIKTPEGRREIVERTLEAYGLVLSGKMLPEELLSDPYHVMELKNKLELTQVELRSSQRLLQFVQHQSQERIISLEAQVVSLRQLVGASLQSLQVTQHHAQNLTDMLQPLLERLTEQHDTAVQQALRTLSDTVQRGLTPADEETVKGALTTIQDKEPGVLRQMLDLLGKGAITGASGKLFYDWLIHIGTILR